MKLFKTAILIFLFIIYGCSEKSPLNFYVPNISRDNLINDLKNSGLEINIKSNEIIEIQNLKSNVNIEIYIGDFDLENKTVEVGLISINYKNVNEKSSITALSATEKEQFKEIFADEVLPYIARLK